MEEHKKYRLHVAANLKLVRLKLGLTEEQVADLLHTHKNNISRMENGRQNPKLDTFFHYGDVYKVHPSIFLLLNPNEKPLECFNGDIAKYANSGECHNPQAVINAYIRYIQRFCRENEVDIKDVAKKMVKGEGKMRMR